VAIYHLHISNGSKAKGASASIRSDYIQREGEYAEGRDKLLYKASGNMPSWAAEEARAYWCAADEGERSNGRVYKEIEAALPRELNFEQQKELATAFASEITAKHQLPFTLAIHEGKGENPHIHLMLSDRGKDGFERAPEQHFKTTSKASPEKGGAPKVRELSKVEWVQDVRQSWERAANLALEKAQSKERIDHRSYQERGLEKTPQIHLGIKAARVKEMREAAYSQGEREPAKRYPNDRVDLYEKIEVVQRHEKARDELRKEIRELEQQKREQELGPAGPTAPVKKERIEAIIREDALRKARREQQPNREEGKDEPGRQGSQPHPRRAPAQRREQQEYANRAPRDSVGARAGHSTAQEHEREAHNPRREPGAHQPEGQQPRGRHGEQARRDPRVQQQDGRQAPKRPQPDLDASQRRSIPGNQPEEPHGQRGGRVQERGQQLRGREGEAHSHDQGTRGPGPEAKQVGGRVSGEAVQGVAPSQPGVSPGRGAGGAAGDLRDGASSLRGGGQQGNPQGGGLWAALERAAAQHSREREESDPRQNLRPREHAPAPKDTRRDEEHIRQKEAERQRQEQQAKEMKAASDARFKAELERSRRILDEMDASRKATEVNNKRHELTLSWKKQGFEVRELQPGDGFKGTYQGQAKVGEKQLDVVTSGKAVFFIEQATKTEKAYVIENDEVVLKVREPATSLEKGDKITFGQREGHKPVVQREADLGQKWDLQRQLDRDKGRDFER